MNTLITAAHLWPLETHRISNTRVGFMARKLDYITVKQWGYKIIKCHFGTNSTKITFNQFLRLKQPSHNNTFGIISKYFIVLVTITDVDHPN